MCIPLISFKSRAQRLHNVRNTKVDSPVLCVELWLTGTREGFSLRLWDVPSPEFIQLSHFVPWRIEQASQKSACSIMRHIIWTECDPSKSPPTWSHIRTGGVRTPYSAQSQFTRVPSVEEDDQRVQETTRQKGESGDSVNEPQQTRRRFHFPTDLLHLLLASAMINRRYVPFCVKDHVLYGPLWSLHSPINAYFYAITALLDSIMISYLIGNTSGFVSVGNKSHFLLKVTEKHHDVRTKTVLCPSEGLQCHTWKDKEFHHSRCGVFFFSRQSDNILCFLRSRVFAIKSPTPDRHHAREKSY